MRDGWRGGVQGATPALTPRVRPLLPRGPAPDWLHQSKQTRRRVVATDQFTLTSLKGRPLPPSAPFPSFLSAAIIDLDENL